MVVLLQEQFSWNPVRVVPTVLPATKLTFTLSQVVVKGEGAVT